MSFDAKRIAVFGDVILDHYIFGRTDRVSPEAPVLVLQHESEAYRLGGAANVALNLVALGAEVQLFSVAGEDAAGATLRGLLKESGISHGSLLGDLERPTTLKTRFLSRHQQLLRHDKERTDEITEALAARLLADLERACAAGLAAIIFQDYNKGVLSAAVIERALAIAARWGVATIVDPKKKNFEAYVGCTLFKPNLKELSEALCINFETPTLNIERLGAAATAFRRQINARYLCVTLGAAGMLICSEDIGFQHIPTIPRTVVDVCGAGDTVVATLAMSLANGFNLAAAAELANLAGGQVCEKIGVVSVEAEALWQEWHTRK